VCSNFACYIFERKILVPGLGWGGQVPRIRVGVGNNFFTEVCSGSEAASYSRLIDFVYHSRVIKKKREQVPANIAPRLHMSRE